MERVLTTSHFNKLINLNFFINNKKQLENSKNPILKYQPKTNDNTLDSRKTNTSYLFMCI